MNKSVFYYLVVLVLIAFLVVMFRTKSTHGDVLKSPSPEPDLNQYAEKESNYWGSTLCIDVDTDDDGSSESRPGPQAMIFRGSM